MSTQVHQDWVLPESIPAPKKVVNRARPSNKAPPAPVRPQSSRQRPTPIPQKRASRLMTGAEILTDTQIMSTCTRFAESDIFFINDKENSGQVVYDPPAQLVLAKAPEPVRGSTDKSKIVLTQYFNPELWAEMKEIDEMFYKFIDAQTVVMGEVFGHLEMLTNADFLELEVPNEMVHGLGKEGAVNCELQITGLTRTWKPEYDVYSPVDAEGKPLPKVFTKNGKQKLVTRLKVLPIVYTGPQFSDEHGL